MLEEHLLPKQKSVVLTTLIVIMVLTTPVIISNVHALSHDQRHDAGFKDGQAACKTTPIQVYNFVHSTKFLSHTNAYKIGYIRGLETDLTDKGNYCGNWIDPGGPQAQRYETDINGTHFYSNYGTSTSLIPHTNMTYAQVYGLVDEKNLHACAANPSPLTCIDIEGNPVNWEIISSK